MKPAAWAMLVLTFILFGLLAVSAVAADAIMTDDEQMHCRLEGGCLFITEQALLSQLRQARDMGKREANAECRRPMT